jgi:peptidoglycan/LPS O-acetylase OafA/YrhL
VLAASLYIVNLVFTPFLWGENGSHGLGFYINVFLAALMVWSLSGMKTLLPALKKFDKLSGDLAYPVFLCHYHVGVLVSRFSGEGVGLSLLLSSSLFILFAAFGIHILVESGVNQLRDRIRSASSPRRVLAE